MPLDIDGFIEHHLRFTNNIEMIKVEYNTDELHELCTQAIEVFSAEPSLVKMNRSCAIVGSLYGKFHNLLAISAAIYGIYPYGLLTKNFVFLGNYVNHCKRSVEILSLLLALKVRHPDRFHLLRGRQECIDINRCFGFFEELVWRFGADEGEKLFNHFNEVFSWMPLACIVKRKIFCVNGGLSPHLRSLEDINKIARPLTDPMSHPLVANLLWSEFDEKATCYRIHPKRDFAVLFGSDNVAKFCDEMNVDLIVRGSSKPVEFARKLLSNNQLIPLFGCLREGNLGSVSLNVDEDLNCTFILIRAIPNPESGRRS